MNYSVKTFRDAGLLARWGKTKRRAPIILVKNPKGKLHQMTFWWAVDQSMYKRMCEVGIVEGFDQHTLLGDIFSV